jgi:putative ABC transport system permease protein
MLMQHVRHAFRLLGRDLGFSGTAILTLALGVGANVAVFAIVEAVLLRPLPYQDAGNLVVLNHRDTKTGITKEFIAIGDYVDLLARQTTMEALVGYDFGPLTILGDGEPLRVAAIQAAPGFFEALRVAPAMGRGLSAGDSRPGAAPVAVLGFETWQTYFGSDAGIVGRSIRIDNTPRQIVGVAPPGFRFPPGQEAAGLIVPMTVPLAAPSGRKSGWTHVVARLKPGVSIEQARSNLAALSAQLEREFPAQNQGSEYFPQSLHDALVGDTRRPLLLMLAAVGVVLLVACGNVGNLLLSRAIGRQREMAVRVALGAGRMRVVAQLLVESLVLAIVAAAVGVAFAYWATPALVALIPRSVQVPGLREVGINRGVLGFAVGITVLAALVFGVIGALTVNPNARNALGSRGDAGGSRASRRLASSLVIAEVALAIVLVAAAGLIVRSFSQLLAVDPGFRIANVITVDIALPADRYVDEDARHAFFERTLSTLAQVPSIADVGAAMVTPLTGNNWTVPFERKDRPVPAGERPPDVGWQLASRGYFSALGIPLKSGRLFNSNDGPKSPPVVIISEAVERQFFPNETAVGHRIKLGANEPEIVGVVGDIRRAALTDRPRADLYYPFEQAQPPNITLFLRTTGDPLGAIAPVLASLRAAEPRLLVLESATLEQIARESMSATRLMLWLLGIFAGVALALAFVGVYGVMSYAVRQRTREIGTRMALGAAAKDIIWIVMRQGLGIAGAGIVFGIAVALLATQSLLALLYGVTPTDLPTLVTAAATLGAATLLACYIPARRAAHVDPARTLTME